MPVHLCCRKTGAAAAETGGVQTGNSQTTRTGQASLTDLHFPIEYGLVARSREVPVFDFRLRANGICAEPSISYNVVSGQPVNIGRKTRHFMHGMTKHAEFDINIL